MKRITLLIALLAGSIGFAQQFEDSAGPVPTDAIKKAINSNQTSQQRMVLITEDFESGTLPSGWSTNIVSGTCDYEFGSALPTGDPFPTIGVFFDDDACGNGAPASIVELLSDVYDTSGSSMVTLGYDVAFQEAGDQEYRVDVWDGSAWQQVAFYDADLDPDIQTESIDITAFSNAALQIRWVFDDLTGSWGWHGGIDNFSLDFDGGGGGGGPAIAYGPENVNANFSSWEVDIPETMTSINPIGTTSFENSGAINLAGDTAYVLGSDGDFWEVDLGTGVYTSMGTVTPSTGGTWAGMELDRTSGTFYALSGNFTIDNHVHVFDPIAGTATALPNPTGMPGGGIALAIDGNGDMFAYDLVDDNFYSIDKTTGVANLVGPLDFDANFGQGMTYDPNSDQVYMSAFNNATFQAEWRIVDTSNGTTTLVGVLGASVPGGLTQAGWSAIPSLTPPDNDICDDAYAINCDDTLSGDTSDGNTDTNGDGAPDEWFRFVDNGGTPLWVTVSTCDQADYDTILTVYDACGGAIVAQNDDGPGCGGFTSELSFLSDGASTFYIAVDGFNGASGAFDLTVTCVGPPPNDLIMNSIDVDEIGVPYVDPNVAMPAATLENGNPQDCNIDGANGVWYNFVAAATGTAHAEIVSPAGSSYVVFFHAPNEMATEDDLVYMFQVGNQCAPATEADIITSGGQAYYVFVVNTGGATDILIDGELLSAADNTIAGFNFYPNPAQDVLNLTSVDTIEHVAIYNLLGQQVIGQQVDALSTQLNISSLATGAYLMKATVNGQVGTYKIIKR